MKESHPVKCAEYTVLQSLELEPAFNQWVPQVLKKGERIISRVRNCHAKYTQRNEKFGIHMSKTVQEVYNLDEENGNTLWAYVIAKETENVEVTFNILGDDENLSAEYEWFQWVMHYDPIATYPNDWREIGRYLGPVIDIDNTMNYLQVDCACLDPQRRSEPHTPREATGVCGGRQGSLWSVHD